MVVYALSDIHGRTFSLDDFKELGFDLNNKDHQIVLIGDYFDRHDDNHGVYLEIQRMRTILGDRLHLIIGNHDGFMLEFIDYVLNHNKVGEPLETEPVLMERWLRNGGAITLEQCFLIKEDDLIFTQAMKDRLLLYKEFCDGLLPYVEIEDTIFTHASVDADYNYDYWDRELIHKPNPFKDRKIVVGHSPYRYTQQFKNLEVVPCESGIGTQCINKELRQGICIIDNGEGDNITRFNTKAVDK